MHKSKIIKITGAIILVLIALAAYIGVIVYAKIYKPNVTLTSNEQQSFFIPTNTSIDQLRISLQESKLLQNQESFWWVAEQKKFQKIHPGHYVIKAGMSNNELVNMFRSGLQTPVKVVVPSVRTLAELAGRVATQIEADSLSIIGLLQSPAFLTANGYTPETIPSLFLPDTYELYWNQTAETFVSKMQKKHDAFWDEKRRSRAQEIGLTPFQVATLASIVQSEQMRYNDEKAIIAGLYLNRLRIRLALQSDPTLLFALDNFSIKRVLAKDKEIDSPYNTYKYPGLPPGPILIPEKSSLNAVLHFKRNDYLYMCAKEDFSGRHNFAKTYDQHRIFARKYQQALNRRGVLR